MLLNKSLKNSVTLGSAVLGAALISPENSATAAQNFISAPGAPVPAEYVDVNAKSVESLSELVLDFKRESRLYTNGEISGISAEEINSLSSYLSVNPDVAVILLEKEGSINQNLFNPEFQAAVDSISRSYQFRDEDGTGRSFHYPTTLIAILMDEGKVADVVCVAEDSLRPFISGALSDGSFSKLLVDPIRDGKVTQAVSSFISELRKDRENQQRFDYNFYMACAGGIGGTLLAMGFWDQLIKINALKKDEKNPIEGTGDLKDGNWVL